MTVANPKYTDMRWDADDNRWITAKEIIGDRRVTLGPQASQQWLDAPEHLAMVLARYRAASALCGNAQTVLEIGCGEGIGGRILAKGRSFYVGCDTDAPAIAVAQETAARDGVKFSVADALDPDLPHAALAWGATVALDVIEHIPAERDDAFMAGMAGRLASSGVCVIGTPSKNAEHLASPQSRAGHCNLYTPERLVALMARHFRLVQMWGMQDVTLHSGHQAMWHYIMAVGIGPRRE